MCWFIYFSNISWSEFIRIRMDLCLNHPRFWIIGSITNLSLCLAVVINVISYFFKWFLKLGKLQQLRTLLTIFYKFFDLWFRNTCKKVKNLVLGIDTLTDQRGNWNSYYQNHTYRNSNSISGVNFIFKDVILSFIKV